MARDIYYRGDSPVHKKGRTGDPITLGPDECYVLGDNSARSSDSRYWGTVPSDSILGTVRMIIFPWHRIREFR